MVSMVVLHTDGPGSKLRLGYNTFSNCEFMAIELLNFQEYINVATILSNMFIRNASVSLV